MNKIFLLLLLLSAGFWIYAEPSNSEIAGITFILLILVYILIHYLKFIWNNKAKSLPGRVFLFIILLIMFPLSFLMFVIDLLDSDGSLSKDKNVKNAYRRMKYKANKKK